MIRWLVLLSVFLAAEYAQGCPPIVSRADWGASAGTCKSELRTPAPGVIIHHTDGSFCTNQETCITQVKMIQNLHQETNKWCDIGYHFLIGEDGTVYEGLGWSFYGMHAKKHNDNLGISFIGSFTKRAPNNEALDAAKSLISCAVDKKVIQKDYRLRGHRDVNPTACPGDKLYDVIKEWPRFKA